MPVVPHTEGGQEDPGFRASLVTKTVSKNTQQTTNKTTANSQPKKTRS